MSEGGRSYLLNAEDNTLAADVATIDTTITVGSAVNLPTVPFYLVIDPFGFENREYLYCTNVAATVLTVTRNLEGSTGTVHTVASEGNLVRFAYDKQHLDDIWDAFETIASNLSIAPYIFDTSTAGTPASGHWQRDNVAVASATELYFNEADELGDSTKTALDEIREGDVIVVVNRSQDGDTERYVATGVATSAASVSTIPVKDGTFTGLGFTDQLETKVGFLWGRELPLGGLSDVEVAGVTDLQVLGYQAGSDTWIPVENNANKGITTLEYLYDANQTATPVAGDVAPNGATPAATTILRISDTDANGDSVGFILDNMKAGDIIILAQRADDTNREDYTVVSNVDQGTYHDVTVTYTSDTGTINDNDPIFLYYFQVLPDLDAVYLRLDTTNDPILGALDMGALQINAIADGTADTDAISKLQMETYADAEAIEQAILRMRWTNAWAPGTYEEHDVSRDGEWTMVANKQTTDRPAPQPVGSPTFVYNGVGGTTSQLATDITFGSRYIVGALAQIEGYRIFTITGNEYSVYIIFDPNGTPLVEQLSEFVAETTGWLNINRPGLLLFPGTEFDLLAVVHEPNPTPTTFNGDWDYNTPQNFTAPLAGEITQPNSLAGVISINKTDDNAGDRSAELATLTTGDIIQYDPAGSGIRWSIVSVSDQGTYINFGVAPAVQEAPDGVTNFLFETVVATPITYFQDAGYWGITGQPVQGILQIEDGVVAINDTAYGTDIFVQEYNASEDWDILALSGGGAGGETGGNAPNGLPVGGTVGQHLYKIDDEDFNSGWEDNTHANLESVGTDDHHTRYTDAEAIAATDPLYLRLDAANDPMAGDLSMGGFLITAARAVQGTSGVNFDLRGGTVGTAVRFRIVGSNDDIQFRKADGSTVALTWAQASDRWNFASAVSMGGFKITNLGTPVDVDDAATKQYVDDTAGLYLPLAGGTMTGDIDMGQYGISNIRDLIGRDNTNFVIKPGAGQDMYFNDDVVSRFRINPNAVGDILFYDTGSVLTFFWDQSSDGWRMFKQLDMEGNFIKDIAAPFNSTDAANKQYVDDRDGLYLPLTGGTMQGIIDMAGNRIVGSTWQIWELWKIRGSAAAGLIINSDLDDRLLQLTSSIYQFFKNDDATPALFYNASGDFWEYGTEIRMDTNKIAGLLDGVDPQDAVTKAQLDAATGGFDGSHDGLSDAVGSGLDWADKHHVAYTDSDAVDANTGIWLSLGGGTLSGALDMGSNAINNSGLISISRSGSGMLVMERTGIEALDYSRSVFQLSGGLLIQMGSIDQSSPDKTIVNIGYSSVQVFEPTTIDDGTTGINLTLPLGLSAATPTIELGPGSGNGIYSDGAGANLNLSRAGQQALRMTAASTTVSVAGTQAWTTNQTLFTHNLDVEFQGNLDWQTRTRWVYDAGGGTTFLTVPEGSAGLQLHSNIDVRSQPIYDGTTGTAANVHVLNNGRMVRFTSARRFKKNIVDLTDDLADIELRPVSFTRKAIVPENTDTLDYVPEVDTDHIGFIADDLADMDSRLGHFDDDGLIQNYDVNAVVAILAAKVNRLENAT